MLGLKTFSYRFVLFIPVFFAIALNLTGYFPPRGLNPGTIRGFIVIIFLLFFLFKYYPSSSTNKFILFFILYIGFLSLLSTNIATSLYGYMKFFIATIMFPLGYYFINEHNKLLELSKFYAIALGLFMINIIFSNIFQLGSSDYLEDSFYFGAGRVNITKSTIILIFASIVLTYNSIGNRKKFLLVFLVISSFITIIGIKRSVLLSAIVGFIIFWITSKSKLLFLKFVIVLSFILASFVVLFPQTLDIFMDRIEAREDKLEITDESLDKEARYNETNRVLNAWVNGSVKHKIFGSEIFNDAYFFNSRRMLHTDYMVLIAGSGVLGIVVWFLMFILMVREKERYWKYLKTDSRLYYYHPVFYSIIFAQLLMSISGTIQGIDLRSFIMLYLGALVGSLKGEYKKLCLVSQNNN